MMMVRVLPPVIDGETVWFHWEQSAPNPFQWQNAFFFRYEGVDLTLFTPPLFHEIFLALQLKVFAAYREPIKVILPDPLPRSSIEFWRAFHRAEQVSIGPVLETVGYELWRATGASRLEQRPYGVFFGGGKDSTLATELLIELYGSEQIVLIQFVGPLSPSRVLERRLTDRQEALMLRPARARLGVATQRVWTDYQARFRREGESARPHIALYSAGALPVLLARGVTLATFSYAWTEYAVIRQRDGRPRHRYASSRPEVLATQSRHYLRGLGVDLTITNLGFLFTCLTAFRLLHERYPAALAEIVPCTHGGVDERWCYQCERCATYAFVGLSVGCVDPAFDYDRLFSQARYIDRLLDYAARGVARSTHGNAPWIPAFSSPIGYTTFCHALANIAVETIADRLSPGGLANLSIVQSLFGNREFPAVGLLPAKTIDLLDHETPRLAASIVTQHISPVADLPGPHLVGRGVASYDFSQPMPTLTEHLDHVRWEPGDIAESPAEMERHS